MRVLVGRIFHESHSFNPVLTREVDFTVLRGPALLDAAEGSTLGGIVKTLRAANVEMVPTLAAVARPGGPVEHHVYEAFKAEILAKTGTETIDAAVFELHGAMTTDRLHDVEGDLLAGLRRMLGASVIIGVGLDLHAHITRTMLLTADVVTACKQNPHADVVEAGERVAELVLETVRHRVKPVTAFVKLPMLLRGGLETADSPLADLHARARDWLKQRPELLDISICNVHSYLDVPGFGQAVLAIANGSGAAAAEAAVDIATELWRARDRFRDSLPTVDEALDTVMDRRDLGPWVFGDRGDRVLAGAAGDSTVILRRLIERGLPLRSAIPITDSASVERARSAGPGAVLGFDIGGKLTPGLRPLALEARVLALGDGRFVMRGPYQAGQPSSLGDTAVVARGSHTLLLTSLAGLTQDPAAFTSQGIDIAAQDLIVAKSGYHFKLSFAGLATPLFVDTPGLTNWRPGFFRYGHARPFYPEDDVELGAITADMFP